MGRAMLAAAAALSLLASCGSGDGAAPRIPLDGLLIGIQADGAAIGDSAFIRLPCPQGSIQDSALFYVTFLSLEVHEPDSAKLSLWYQDSPGLGSGKPDLFGCQAPGGGVARGLERRAEPMVSDGRIAFNWIPADSSRRDGMWSESDSLEASSLTMSADSIWSGTVQLLNQPAFSIELAR